MVQSDQSEQLLCVINKISAFNNNGSITIHVSLYSQFLIVVLYLINYKTAILFRFEWVLGENWLPGFI